jgi:putative ABC transport system permease protein
MRYALFLAWRSLRSHPIQSLVSVLVTGVAIALTITVLALGDGMQRGIVRASDPFGVLVIGPKGDGQQLVMNSILLQGLPPGTIPYSVYETLKQDTRVRLAVPLVYGDNVAGAPIIGTSADFFLLKTSLDSPPAFQPEQGRLFEADFEAVLGYQAGDALGLTAGDSFRASHGFEPGLESDVHEQIYTIVGILQRTGSPYDKAVFTTVETVWHVHEEESEAIDSAFVIGDVGDHERLTSIFVQPAGFAGQNQLCQGFYAGTEAQAAFPGQELGQLFDRINQTEELLVMVGYLVPGMACLTVFMSMYSMMVNREREIAIMRSLGSRRTDVFLMVVLEAVMLVVAGSLLGRLIGYSAARMIASRLEQQSMIPVVIQVMPDLEALLWLAAPCLSIAAGLLPAVLAYRLDVVEKLSVTYWTPVFMLCGSSTGCCVMSCCLCCVPPVIFCRMHRSFQHPRLSLFMPPILP